MLCVELTIEALHTLHGLTQFGRLGEHIASVDVDRQFALPVKIAQLLVDSLVDIIVLGEPGVKNRAHAILHTEVNPAGDRRRDLLIGQVLS